MKIVVINATVLLVAILISCSFLATTAQQQEDADSRSTLNEEFEPSTSTGNNDDGSMKRGPNAAGISFSTRFCQAKVHQDVINNSYDAIDRPLLLNTTSSDDVRYSYEGVQLFELEAGIVTPMWTDRSTGTERGQALLVIPDTLHEEQKNGPRILYIHGGGWNTCSPTTCGYATFVSKLAKLYNMPILSIDYTLIAPVGNGTFSAILAQAGKAVHFLATNDPLDIMSHHNNDGNGHDDDDNDNHTTRYNATTTTIDKQEQHQPPPIFIMGDSSGGGTAISALVAQASPEGLPESNGAKITAGQTFSPWINLASNSPTYFSQLFGVYQDAADETEKDTEDVLLGDINFGFGGNLSTLVQANYDWGAAYSPQNINDPVASPLNAPASWLKNLPPLSMHVGMAELLASDTALFATAVARAGGRWVENHAFDGMWHDFQMYAAGCGSNETVVLADSSLEFSKQFVEEVLLMSTSTTEIVHDAANDKDKSNNDDDDDTTGSSSSYNNNLFCTMNHYEYPTGSDSMAGMACRPRENIVMDPTTHTTIISKDAISSDATTRTNRRSIGFVVGHGAIVGLLYSSLLI